MRKKRTIEQSTVDSMLPELGLLFMQEQYKEYAAEAAKEGVDHVGYLERLAEGELALRRDKNVQRRIEMARFPVIKLLEQFDWDWPKKIPRLQVQQLFRFGFMEDKTNAIFLGGVGLGKSHLATALGYAACQRGMKVLFKTAIDVINGLEAAHAAGRLSHELRKYRSPDLLILDELGYLPLDKRGADLLFQIISQRYEQGSLVITTNRTFKQWPEIFNNDSILTSAILDRLLHKANVIKIEGPSYRMKDQVEF